MTDPRQWVIKAHKGHCPHCDTDNLRITWLTDSPDDTTIYCPTCGTEFPAAQSQTDPEIGLERLLQHPDSGKSHVSHCWHKANETCHPNLNWWVWCCGCDEQKAVIYS